MREGRQALLEEQRKRQEAGEDAAAIIAAKPAQPAQREPPKPPTNGAAADGRVRNAEDKLLAQAKTAKANFYAQQVAQQRPPFAELLPEYARDNAELKELFAKAELVFAKIQPPPAPAEGGGAAGAAALAAPAGGAQMDCDEDGAEDIFQEEAAAYLMGANEAMDALAAKRIASDLLGHLQRSKKLRLVQPAQPSR